MRISGLAEIAGQFGGMLIDQFGVIHDGEKLYPGTLRVLMELRGLGIPVAVMTNSGKRAEANVARLVKMGVPRDCFAGAVSSGEVAYARLFPPQAGGPSHLATKEPSSGLSATFSHASHGRRHLQQSPSPVLLGMGEGGRRPDEGFLASAIAPPQGGGLRAFLIGRAGDAYGFDGVSFVDDPRDAEVILILGSNAPATSLADYRLMLEGLTLPAICCNPDKLMLSPQGLLPAPGAIAALYEEMGGTVTWIGKPYAEIYRHAAKLIGNPQGILCIGDSAEHDVAGGRNAGLSTLLVMTGVSAGLDPAALAPQPDYWMDAFTWTN